MGRPSADEKTVELRSSKRGTAEARAKPGKPRASAEGTPPESALPLHQRVAGRYEILELLGEGGMGAVYLAIDEALGGTPVALKVVARELSEESALEELRREVLFAQRVTHRNVCRIHDLEQIDGRWMIKMECVYGETLSARVARGRLSTHDALVIARQIAGGWARRTRRAWSIAI